MEDAYTEALCGAHSNESHMVQTEC
jgi:hypothetical protein